VKLPNPNSQRGIELQQAHVELVMRVLGGEQQPPSTSRGKPTVFVEVISGKLVSVDSGRMVGPGGIAVVPKCIFDQEHNP